MTKLTEILDVLWLRGEVEGGNVRIQTHPEFPHLMIANYTEQCAWLRNWNDVMSA